MSKMTHELYRGEPACNFERKLTRPEYSISQIDDWAAKYLEETKKYVMWARDEEDPIKKREIYNMSIGLHKLLEIYFGYYGETENMVERAISRFWYDLRDESVIVNQVWIAIKSSIIQYDPQKNMTFGSFLHMNIKKRISLTVKQLKNKAGDYQIPTSCLSTVDESGNYLEFEFEDIRNNYSILEVKEQVEYLMEKLSNDKRVNHEKQKYILNFLLCDQVLQYSQAEKQAYEKQKPNSQKQPKIKYNKKFPVKQLAEILSEKFGGSVRSNINYIYCFQKRMEKILSDKRLNTTYPKSPKELKDRNRRKFFNQQTYEKNKAYEEYLDKFKKGLVGERYVI